MGNNVISGWIGGLRPFYVNILCVQMSIKFESHGRAVIKCLIVLHLYLHKKKIIFQKNLFRITYFMCNYTVTVV